MAKAKTGSVPDDFVTELEDDLESWTSDSPKETAVEPLTNAFSKTKALRKSQNPAIRDTGSTTSSDVLEEIITTPPLDPPTPPPKATSKRKAGKSRRTATEYATLEPHGLAPVETEIDNHWMYVFFRFCAERHRMQEKRDSGVPRDKLSDDETMQKSFIGNVFRELDAGSKNMKGKIMAIGDQSHEEICCKS